MSELEMYEKSFERPNDYFKLPISKQWIIDKKLGILDWIGGNLTKEQNERFQKHYIQ